MIRFIRKLFGFNTPIPASAVPVTPPVVIPKPPMGTMLSNDRIIILPGTITCLPSETDMIKEAFNDLNKVLVDPSYKANFLASSFTETNGITNQQIWDAAVAKSPITVNFTMFTGSFIQNRVYGTMGYEDENFPGTCFANRYFIKTKEVCASLIDHELWHVLGYHHYDVMSTSIPYTNNRLYDTTAKLIGLE